jgi:predicted dienelactone hydrolase
LTASGATIAIANLTAECDDGEDAACQMRDTWLEANPGTDTIDLSDDRIWATVALAPWTGLVLDEGLADIDTPVMVLTGDIDETTNISMVTGIVDEIETDVLHFGIIAGAGHHQFSPLGCETYGCEGQIENNITMDLTNASVIVFFAQLLDWPDADTYAFPETEYIEWQ